MVIWTVLVYEDPTTPQLDAWKHLLHFGSIMEYIMHLFQCFTGLLIFIYFLLFPQEWLVINWWIFNLGDPGVVAVWDIVVCPIQTGDSFQCQPQPNNWPDQTTSILHSSYISVIQLFLPLLDWIQPKQGVDFFSLYSIHKKKWWYCLKACLSTRKSSNGDLRRERVSRDSAKVEGQSRVVAKNTDPNNSQTPMNLSNHFKPIIFKDHLPKIFPWLFVNIEILIQFIHIQQNSINSKFNIKERKEEKVGIQISLFQQQALGGG